MNEEFEIEMPGANEEYQYALELIKNMAGIADDLDPDVFAETMMIYAATYLLANERIEFLSPFLLTTLKQIEDQLEPVVCH